MRDGEDLSISRDPILLPSSNTQNLGGDDCDDNDDKCLGLGFGARSDQI